MRYYENDEFTIPNRYQKMSAEQLENRCRIYEIFHKLCTKVRRPSKTNKLKDAGIKVNF